MEANRSDASSGYQPAECGVEVARLDVPPGGGGEHQTDVDPVATGSHSIGGLTLAVFVKSNEPKHPAPAAAAPLH
ncbi:MAG TPA: hypothetical protein VI011_10140 [Asanoa sp.]